MKKQFSKKILDGFTLLELLVVIGIIGILVSLITVSFANAQKSGRDSRRRQDLVSIQNAMEQYYAANNFQYPTCGGGAVTCNALATYMQGGVVPTDPLSTTVGGVTYQYTYSYNVAGADYTVTAYLEKTGSPITVKSLQ